MMTGSFYYFLVWSVNIFAKFHFFALLVCFILIAPVMHILSRCTRACTPQNVGKALAVVCARIALVYVHPVLTSALGLLCLQKIACAIWALSQ